MTKMQIKASSKFGLKKKKKNRRGIYVRPTNPKTKGTLAVTVYVKKYFTRKSLALLACSVLCTGSVSRLTTHVPSNTSGNVHIASGW